MAQELTFSAAKHENMRERRNGAAWLEHWEPNGCIFPKLSNRSVYMNQLKDSQ